MARVVACWGWAGTGASVVSIGVGVVGQMCMSRRSWLREWTYRRTAAVLF